MLRFILPALIGIFFSVAPGFFAYMTLASSVYTFVPKQTFTMGEDASKLPLSETEHRTHGGAPANPESLPLHKVEIEDLFITPTEITNKQFARFVSATQYVTSAEKAGFSYDLTPGSGEKEFTEKKGVTWKTTGLPDSHPVIHVSWTDAIAYATWVGGRLPTEAEWEAAARGGIEQNFYPWGNEWNPKNAQVWWGHYPDKRENPKDRFTTAPVGSYPANHYGLHDVIGNVWEWTQDWYDEKYYSRSPLKNPRGADAGTKKVARGGSWFCSPEYCAAYRLGFRGRSEPKDSFSNMGFRVAFDNQPSFSQFWKLYKR